MNTFKKCSILISLRCNLPVAAGLRKLRYVSQSPFPAYSHHAFAAPPFQFCPVHQLSVVVLTCSFVHAAVGPHSHTMNIPKRNFSGWKPLPLVVLKQGFQLTRPKPADLPKHSLAKVEEATLHPGVGKVALNGRDQGCFEITNKFSRIKLDAKFFRFGMQHFKYPVIRGQIFPYTQAIYDG
ncbi:hypothetical protein T10_11824 [Trichinella papuae]|uniref:Uncharacterized protein n=1 Tax=Trichinella papuae TaxID=268474 RepID=A0A0V1MV23_9BILA|nr:hypothetical protein T10_11824 [Trichinella papuae]